MWAEAAEPYRRLGFRGDVLPALWENVARNASANGGCPRTTTLVKPRKTVEHRRATASCPRRLLGAAKALLPFAAFVRPRWRTREHYRGRCNLSATMRLTGTRDTIRSRNQRYRPREPPWFSHSSSAAP